MLFSLIISTYNCANFLDRLIENLAHLQKELELEIVVCDDASTDGTYERLVSDKRITKAIVIKNDSNMGVSYTRNRAASVSTGKILVFQDCDDISLVKRFQLHERHLTNFDCLSYVSSQKVYSGLKRDIVFENVEDAKVSSRSLCRFIFLGERI